MHEAYIQQAFRMANSVAEKLLAAAVTAIASIAVMTVGHTSAAAEPPPIVQRLEHYAGALEKPIEEKIRLGDEAILEWQHQINLKFGQDIRPRKASPNHPLVPLMRKVLAELPPKIHALASKYVVAVYLLEDDFGTGTTDAVLDAQGRWRYSYIALNLTVLERTANDWSTWKENSTFTQDPDFQITMILEDEPDDTVEGALPFIFLHELGHSLGLSVEAHGFWDAEELPASTRDSPYVGISWVDGGEGKMLSRWKERFPQLSELDFYSFKEAPLSTADAVSVYGSLAVSDFPSLYGATNLFDDFAEAFAIYVHHQLLGKPYRVVIRHKQQILFTYTSCIVSGLCPRKTAALEALLYND